MGVMAVRLLITILLLFHQISSSTQQSVQVDQFTSPNDRDEILSRDRRTLNSNKDCPDTVLLRSCQRNLNETQQELVEARKKISGLERESARERNETKDKDFEMSLLTAKMAQMETDLMGKIAETKRKNDDLEAQLKTQNTEVRDGKAKIGELEGKINALQSKNSHPETQINRTMNLLDLYRGGWSFDLINQKQSILISAKTVDSDHLFWIGLQLGIYDGKWRGYAPTYQLGLICKRSSQF